MNTKSVSATLILNDTVLTATLADAIARELIHVLAKEGIASVKTK